MNIKNFLDKVGITHLLNTINNLFVHKNGSQVINGVKIFTDDRTQDPTTSNWYSDNILGYQSLEIDKYTTPTDRNYYLPFLFVDKNFQINNLSTTFPHTNEYVLGLVEYSHRKNGGCDLKLSCYNKNAEAHSTAVVSCGFDSDEIPFAGCVSTSTTRTNGSDIVTRDFIPKDTRIVHTSGNEDIDGSKQFRGVTSNIGTHPNFVGVCQDLVKGGTRSVNRYCTFAFNEKSGTFSIDSKYRLGYVEFSAYTNNSTYAAIGVGQNTANSTTLYGICIGYTSTNAYEVRPNTNNIFPLGTGSYKWTQLYANTATINTSDERLKNSIEDVPDEILDVWEDINWKQFKMNDATESKGIENARIHSGLIAQQLMTIFKSKNIDISKYAFFCHDVWDETKEEKDEYGNVTMPYKEAGDAYSLRYEEVLCIEAAYQRRKVKRLESELQELKTKFALLEEKLNKL